MSLRNFNIGSFVKWDKKLDRAVDEYEELEMWRHEPLSCFFEVTDKKTKNTAGGGDTVDLVLSCVADCGGHYLDRINEAEFDQASFLLDKPVLVEVNMSEMAEMFSGTKPKYSFEEDVAYFVENLQKAG